MEPLSGGLLADFHSQEEQRPLLRTASPGTDAAPHRHAVIASQKGAILRAGGVEPTLHPIVMPS